MPQENVCYNIQQSHRLSLNEFTNIEKRTLKIKLLSEDIYIALNYYQLHDKIVK